VPSLAAWTRAHPFVSHVLAVCYGSLLPQFIAVPILLGVVFQDRDRLWEFAFHFHFCLAATVLCLALFPAQCAFLFYGFESTLNQSRFIAHFNALREGSFSVIRFKDIEGLISMPSFHVVGALFATWAMRGDRRFFAVFAVINGLLVLATFMTGAHYVIDVVASSALVAISVMVYRWAVAGADGASAAREPGRALRDGTSGEEAGFLASR
jgi:hypothetical protein